MYLVYKGEQYRERAILLAARMKAQIIEAQDSEKQNTVEGGIDAGLHLELSDEGLVLRQGNLSLKGDFSELIPRIKKSNLDSEMQVKAARLKNYAGKGLPILLDATAGMGEDSFILAAAGFKVILYEYDAVIASLLEDALIRASRLPETASIAARMQLIIGDSIAAMKSLETTQDGPDVILLDPMFPARSKSAMVKKKFQLLQQLEQPCADEMDLLNAAISANPEKIVIKRPAKGPYLAGLKPDYSIDGKAVRYDCIVNVAAKRNKLKGKEDN